MKKTKLKCFFIWKLLYKSHKYKELADVQVNNIFKTLINNY